MTTRRRLLDLLGRFGLAGAVSPLVAAPAARAAPSAAPGEPSDHYDLVVIGTGFGGTMTALTVAYKLDQQRAGQSGLAPLRILMIERGTWWTTPMETVQDKRVATRDFLIWKNQPTQEWSSLADSRGLIDLLNRCRLSERRPQGLYDFAPIGKRGVIFTRNDGVSVLRASGVGGGSLVYSKISIRPPENLFDDPRWPAAWQGSAKAPWRSDLYKRAMTAIHVGIEAQLTGNEELALGTGASNILTRSARIAPVADEVDDAAMPSTDGRKRLRIVIEPDAKLAGRERELIDRARIFQTAMKPLTPHYGAVDLAINDIEHEPAGGDGQPSPTRTKSKLGKNYCERHGRCNVGCLPGAGQTLNKQILQAVYGKLTPDDFDKAKPQNSNCALKSVTLELRALCEVSHLSETADGRYLIHLRQRPLANPAQNPQPVLISADRVVVAAGTLGSAELLLRSRERSAASGGSEGLGGLSERLGHGFSPNGDHLALLSGTKERVNSNVGPVTTSVAQFQVDGPKADGFYQVEDQGIPRALTPLARHGYELLAMLAERHSGLDRFLLAISGAVSTFGKVFDWQPRRTTPRQDGEPGDLSEDRPESEDELGAHIMCIVAQGKDAANGVFRLERGQLRMEREDGLRFHQDPIYTPMRQTLADFAKQLLPKDKRGSFVSPLTDAVIPGFEPVVLTSHPLGGCAMADSAAQGVVDATGRVFRVGGAGGAGSAAALYPGLYVADGSVIPCALGVNPSLTISAVALSVADRILEEWGTIPARAAKTGPPRECTPPAA